MRMKRKRKNYDASHSSPAKQAVQADRQVFFCIILMAMGIRIEVVKDQGQGDEKKSGFQQERGRSKKN